MILIIDNYDSFVHNLARYVEQSGQTCAIHRNDKISVQDVEKLNSTAIIISPGPCTPKKAGICIDLIKTLGPKIPILGVCLGHQAIGEAYGGETISANKPIHGKACHITHDETPLFKDIPNPLEIGRYHSLITKLPDTSELIISAQSNEGEIMAMHHKTHPVYGVQFHPESILTPRGLDIIKNFLHIAKECKQTSNSR